eukprot:10140050-Prorocentrum_lima.AAC.1
MTSSLVGSEMCIRDRPVAAMIKPRPTLFLLNSGHRVSLTNVTFSSTAFTCLLYTSDAADDM